jgi:ABC-type amino acid transport substrate-binding protein
MSNWTMRVSALLLIGLVLGACTASQPAPQSQEPPPNYLRVGVTPDFAPMIFREGDEIVGVEVDFARALGQRLGRPVRFVELRWSEQVPALLVGETDIIMSGMSVTTARQARIAFTDPYLKSGLLALIRREDARVYSSRDAILGTRAVVGFRRGTTGEVFVQQSMARARPVGLAAPGDAPFALRRHEIDLFIHDAPSIVWLASEHEGDLTVVPALLNEELLAWGVRRTDTDFRRALNEVLAQWRQDGTRKAILSQWIPYLDLLEE